MVCRSGKTSISDWASDLGNGWSGNDGLLEDSWGRAVNDGVESVDWISGVGDGTDSTIGLNKRVLSLDDISVAGLVGGLGVSGQTVRDGVSVVVLWMGIVGLSSNGLGDNWSSECLGHWGVGVSNWSCGVGSWSVGWANNSGGGNSHESQDKDGLDHFDLFWLQGM